MSRFTRQGWLVGGLVTGNLVLMAAMALLWVGERRAAGASAVASQEDPLFLLTFPGLLAVGGLLAFRRPANPVGWLFLAAASAVIYASFAEGYGRYAQAAPGGLPAADWVVWTQWVGFSGFVLPAVFVPLVFPDGHLPSPRWRPVVWVGVAGAAAMTVSRMLRPGPLPEFTGAAVPNPAALAGAGGVLDALQTAGQVLLGIALAAAVASLLVRYRRAGPRGRGQLAFVGLAVAALFVLTVAGNLLTGGRLDDHAVLSTLVGMMLMLGLPAAVAAAILRRGLYDIDRLVRRSVVYGVLWLGITGAYVGVAWAVGLAASDRVPVALALLLTVVATVVFDPARRALSGLADRWVFGRRASGYELAAALGSATDDGEGLAPLARRLAELACRGVGATWAQVRLTGADGAEITARYPPPPADDEAAPDRPSAAAATPARVVPLTWRDERFGVIECAPDTDRGDRDQDRRVLELLAREAALAARAIRLADSLADQVATVQRQADELAASRSRIVAAAEAERRRIERDLHDGAQQELVALIAKVRLARDLLARDPAMAAPALEEVQADAARALRDVRALAQGIHPSALGDQGLIGATEERTTRLPLPVRVVADAGVRAARHGDAVEGAAFFVVSEALTNVLKHARATSATVHVTQDNGTLHVEVTDDGCGIDPATARGTGLVDLADRVEALGGALAVHSTPGRTSVRAQLPARPLAGP